MSEPPVRPRAATLWARLEDGHGLPPASRAALSLGRTLALVATIFFAGVALWEIGAPFGAGHYAASSAVGLAGENMLRFGTILPITHHPEGVPTAADCYCHHPFGIFWTSALFSAVFGHHDWVCRAPAALLSTLTPPLFYALGRSLYGPLAGGLAALGFVLTPIALAFANFNALEVPLIAGMLLTSVAYVRFRQTFRRRWLGIALFGLIYTVNTDWAGFVFAAALFALSFLRLLVPRAFAGRLDLRRAGAFLGWGALLVLAAGTAYVLALSELGQLERLIEQGRLRTQGSEQPLDEVLAGRRYWLLLMFTPLAIAVGKLAAPVLALRAALRRSELEALPLALLAMAVFQYVVFKQGADVHVFWPHCFAAYFALALAALAQTGADLAARFEARLDARPRLRRALALAPFALAALMPLAMARDALSTLVYARKTGGRFNERGSFIQPDKDKVAALEFLRPRTPENAVVALDRNMRQSAWVPWVLGRPARTAGTVPRTGRERYHVTDARFSDAAGLTELARLRPVTAIGPFFVADLQREPAPLVAYAVERREPSVLERVFVSSTHALREVVPDPFWTWALRDMLRQDPNPPPAGAPRGFEQLVIAHNAALAGGDAGRARSLRERVLREVDRSRAVAYRDGTKLVGVRFESGASDVLSVLFEAAGAGDERFMITSHVEARMPGSLVPADELPRDVGLPTSIPRSGWKPGFLYLSVTEILKRPGRERFVGWWASTRFPPLTESGQRETTLLVLP